MKIEKLTTENKSNFALNYANQTRYNYLYITKNGDLLGYDSKLSESEIKEIDGKLIWKRKGKKYTAIEYLANSLESYVDLSKDKFQMDWDLLSALLQEAREIEKKQIFKALQAGVNIEIGVNEFNNDLTYQENFEKYYQKTYK